MEAGAEHPGALTTPSRRSVGIDLGTTNCAVAWIEPRRAARVFSLTQLVAPGETGDLHTLPSFLYFPTDAERASEAIRLPWNAQPVVVVGRYAREQGALVPSRQVSSAKSWLSNGSVDRTAPLLPWGFEDVPHMSPVDASTRLLEHIRDAWNHHHLQQGKALRLEQQPIVLTVPASFDEEARELTVSAARAAGFEHLVLLEEPLAAVYAWISAHRRSLADLLGRGALILVCDVGGGTTDFSLIRAEVEDGNIAFERIAIGEHLLLGGDNLDLALATLVEQKMAGAQGNRFTLVQRQSLRRKCSAAKERLLSDPAPSEVTITVLGSGRGVVGGGMTVVLTRDEVERAVSEGFLPATSPDDLPVRDRRLGLRELGLPYETDPAITRHLAAFLARAAGAGLRVGPTPMARPDAVLFNGGFFTPALARERVLETLASWFGSRPLLLENPTPEAAVALGAAFYGRLRSDPAAAKRLLIRAGSARAYYVGVDTSDAGPGGTALCVVPRGTQEGTTLASDRSFTVMSNTAVAFTLYSSTDREDGPDALVRFTDAGDVHRHAPLVTALRFGKRSRRVAIDVRLRVTFTEVGTLELWCESQSTGHRWRLSFNLRAPEGDPLEDAESADEGGEPPVDQVIVADDAVDRAVRLIRDVFGPEAMVLAPAALTGELEAVLGHGKHAWPLPVIRKLADVLLDVADGRRKGAALETRWLNLAGFCLRPGFGTSADAVRVSDVRKVYVSGLGFPRDVQCQVEWLVLWQRVSAGFNAGQQRELAQRVIGQLGLGDRKPPRLNPQIERESWRLLGNLERLDAGQRAKLGDELLGKLRRDPLNDAWLWTIARLGARAPLYGPLNTVISPAIAERWIGQLLDLRQVGPETLVAVAQIGARTGDPARDLTDGVREAAGARLRSLGTADHVLEPLLQVVTRDRDSAGRGFGESLPEGLRLSDKHDTRYSLE